MLGDEVVGRKKVCSKSVEVPSSDSSKCGFAGLYKSVSLPAKF